MGQVAIIPEGNSSRTDHNHAESSLGNSVRHYINPLHLYCRLKDMGMSKEKAKAICRVYGPVYSRADRLLSDIKDATRSLEYRLAPVTTQIGNMFC